MGAPAVIRIFTFKEGLLSRLAHDLQLEVERFELTLREGRVEARFGTGSLRVLGAMVRGRLDAGLLSHADLRKIEETMRAEVLRSDRHPQATLTGELRAVAPARFAFDGDLELGGRSAPLRAELTLGERITARLELQPSRWGIAPFRALGGALKLQDRVGVELDLPAAGPEVALGDEPLRASARWSRGDD